MSEWTSIAQLGTAIATFALLAVWVFYAKLFYSQHRERTRPWLLFHQGNGPTVDGHCLLANMSEHTAHISCVLAVVHLPHGSFARRLTSASWVPVEEDEAGVAAHAFREGPLPSGGVLSLGTFDEVFGSIVSAEAGEVPEDMTDRERYREAQALEVRVIAASPVDEHGPLGAHRRFAIYGERGGPVLVRPVELYTPQLRSRRDKQRVERWLRAVWAHDPESGPWRIED